MHMYMTNKQLAEQLGKKDTDLVIQHLETIKLLLLRQGKNLKKDSILSIIEKNNPDLVRIIRLLHSLSKMNKDAVQDIIRLIKENFEHTPVFTIYSPSDKDIADHIKTTYNAETHPVNIDKPRVLIKGEGTYYSRSLDQDLNKLLW